MNASSQLIVVALAAIALVHCEPFCSNKVLEEESSPDKQYRAIVFQRDCGATTDFSTQVSVLPSSEGLQGSGNVLIMEPDKSVAVRAPSDVQVVWIKNRTLRIRYAREVRIFRQEHKVGDVDIVYGPGQPGGV